MNNNKSLNITENSQITNKSSTVVCYELILSKIGSSNIRIVDVFYLLWNIIFLVFLSVKICSMRARLRRSNNKMIFTTLILVIVACIINCIRPLLTIAMSNEITNKVLWILNRFVLLLIEMTLVIMGFVNSHHNTQSGVGCIVVVAASFALLNAVAQGLLDLGPYFPGDKIHSFAFGSPRLIAFSSAFILVMYVCLVIILASRRHYYFKLPSYFYLTKCSVYLYCSFLFIIYAATWIGAVIYINHNDEGLCVLNFGALLYCLFYVPVVYFLFLRGYFSVQKGPFAFLYRQDLYQNPTSIGLSINSGDIRRSIEVNGSVTSRLLHAFDGSERSFNTIESELASTENQKYVGVGSTKAVSLKPVNSEETPIILEDMNPVLIGADGDEPVNPLKDISHHLMAIDDDNDFYTGQLDAAIFDNNLVIHK